MVNTHVGQANLSIVKTWHRLSRELYVLQISPAIVAEIWL